VVDDCGGGVESEFDGWIIVGGECECGERFDGCRDGLNEFCWMVIKSNTGLKWQAGSESIVYY